MKIKTAEKSYEEVLALPGYQHKEPTHQKKFFRWLMKTLSAKPLSDVHFSYTAKDMEKIGVDDPCLILMNHSSFIDLEIAATVLYPREFHIVCTADGFVGKEGLMRSLGCIPTFKFISDPTLVRDMLHTVRKLHASILMYPEASYTFDGTATPLPESLGKFLKLLKVPVVMIRTFGAFSRDPLYNNLQLRKVDVSAEMRCILTPEEIKEKSVSELNEILAEQFTFDNWGWQKENNIRITEPFRADGLHRVLYKCPCCGTEGKMLGKGIKLTCEACGSAWELTELGKLAGVSQTFTQVPTWYAWERECVKQELIAGTYRMELPVEIYMMVNLSAVYHVGDGTILHTPEGFHLTGCDGKLDYTQTPLASYGLYSDYFWYEIGDMISIGDAKAQYYCFPKEAGANVAKARLAAEELYKLRKSD